MGGPGNQPSLFRNCFRSPGPGRLQRRRAGRRGSLPPGDRPLVGPGYFGAAGDIPVPGDWAGIGWAQAAIFRPATGLWVLRGLTRFYYGTAGDIPLPRDYDDDGRMDYTIFRPSTGLWAGVRSTEGPKRGYWGTAGDRPVPANYDGDGWVEPAIFRPGTGLWAITHWQDLESTRYYFGTLDDLPVTR